MNFLLLNTKKTLRILLLIHCLLENLFCEDSNLEELKHYKGDFFPEFSQILRYGIIKEVTANYILGLRCGLVLELMPSMCEAQSIFNSTVTQHTHI